MSQFDFGTINPDSKNGTELASDLNSWRDAVMTNNSGATEPVVTYPFMWWSDTTNNLLKQRNSANTAWIDKGPLDAGFGTSNGFATLVSGTVPASQLPNVTPSKLSFSTVLQRVEATPYTAHWGTTSIIPGDDTIPQNTEGVELLNVSITPKSGTSKLLVEFTQDAAFTSGPNTAAFVLFRDSGANAIAVQSIYGASSAVFQGVYLRHTVDAVSSATTTFYIRAGTASATYPLYGNGGSQSRAFGGVCAARLTITEVMV